MAFMRSSPWASGLSIICVLALACDTLLAHLFLYYLGWLVARLGLVEGCYIVKVIEGIGPEFDGCHVCPSFFSYDVRNAVNSMCRRQVGVSVLPFLMYTRDLAGLLPKRR